MKGNANIILLESLFPRQGLIFGCLAAEKWPANLVRQPVSDIFWKNLL